MNEAIEEWLARLSPAVAGLARDLCRLAFEVLPGAVVTVDTDLIGFGVGPGYRGVRFTVAAYPSTSTSASRSAPNCPIRTG